MAAHAHRSPTATSTASVIPGMSVGVGRGIVSSLDAIQSVLSPQHSTRPPDVAAHVARYLDAIAVWTVVDAIDSNGDVAATPIAPRPSSPCTLVPLHST